MAESRESMTDLMKVDSMGSLRVDPWEGQLVDQMVRNSVVSWADYLAEKSDLTKAAQWEMMKAEKTAGHLAEKLAPMTAGKMGQKMVD